MIIQHCFLHIKGFIRAETIAYEDFVKFNGESGSRDGKGSLNNISQKAIKLFDKYQIKRKNLTAIVGPCLGVKNYEVDKNFQKKFIKRNIKYTKFFRYKNKEKFYLI